MKERYERPLSDLCDLGLCSGLLMASNEDLPVVPVSPFRYPSFDDDPWQDD